MGLSQLESDEDNQWSEEDSDVMSSRSEVRKHSDFSKLYSLRPYSLSEKRFLKYIVSLMT